MRRRATSRSAAATKPLKTGRPLGGFIVHRCLPLNAPHLSDPHRQKARVATVSCCPCLAGRRNATACAGEIPMTLSAQRAPRKETHSTKLSAVGISPLPAAFVLVGVPGRHHASIYLWVWESTFSLLRPTGREQETSGCRLHERTPLCWADPPRVVTPGRQVLAQAPSALRCSRDFMAGACALRTQSALRTLI